jgi:hypothetical protein
MNNFSRDDLDTISDIRAMVAAAGALARLDEALKHTPCVDAVFRASALRDEAIGIASLEGSFVRKESLCRLLGNREASNLDRAVRLAADIHDALELVGNWGNEVPMPEAVRSVFDTADASAGRRIKQDLAWSLEEDCHWLHSEFASFAEKPNPWDAMETLRLLSTSGRFLGTARRVALIVSGWVVARGFGCGAQVVGLGSVVARDAEAFRDAAQSRADWLATMGDSLRRVGEAGMARIGDGKATRATMLALCPPEKASSSVEHAIEFMMKTPVFTAKKFAESLDLTPRGAKVVLDKLEDKDLVEVDGGLRNRMFVNRRAM